MYNFAKEKVPILNIGNLRFEAQLDRCYPYLTSMATLASFLVSLHHKINVMQVC